MDGPSVNWSVLDKFNTKLDDQGHQETLTIGSCGLYSVNGALQSSIQKVNWRVSNPVDIGRKLNIHKTFKLRPVSTGKLLKVIYRLFHESPAQRDTRCFL